MINATPPKKKEKKRQGDEVIHNRHAILDGATREHFFRKLIFEPRSEVRAPTLAFSCGSI